mgnify:CR=1 FL=1
MARIHERQFRVRHYECDAFGHVNNATVASYLEMARTEAWIQLFRDRDPLGVDFSVHGATMAYGVTDRLEQAHNVAARPFLAGQPGGHGLGSQRARPGR